MNNLPYEINEQIAIHLPIDASLTIIALAFKSGFTHLLLKDQYFAQRHFKFYLTFNSMQYESFWIFLDTLGLSYPGRAWTCLPVTYKAAIVKQILSEPQNYNSFSGEAPEYLNFGIETVRTDLRNWYMSKPMADALFLILITSSPTTRELRNLVLANECRMLTWISELGTVSRNIVTRIVEAVCGHEIESDAILTMQEIKFLTIHELQKLFLIACQFNYPTIVKCLLLIVDPTTDKQAAFRKACQNGNAELVKLLLQDSRVNPRFARHSAVKAASRREHWEVLRVLVEDGGICLGSVDGLSGTEKSMEAVDLNEHCE